MRVTCFVPCADKHHDAYAVGGQYRTVEGVCRNVDPEGGTVCALINDALELAVYLRYNIRELPCLAEWKVLRDAEYVLAFEPGNCHAVGREEQIRRGMQEILAPMQTRRAQFEIGIADGPRAIAALEAEIDGKRVSNG